MNMKSIALLGAVGIAVYLVYKNTAGASTLIPLSATTSAGAAGTSTNLNTATDQLVTQINSNTYNAQALRLASLSGLRGFSGGAVPGGFASRDRAAYGYGGRRR